MKKIALIFVLIFLFLAWGNVFASDDDEFEKADYEQLKRQRLSTEEASKISWYTPPWLCSYSEWVSLSSFLNGCKPKSLVWWSDMKVELWFKKKVNNWIKNISLVLWIIAIWALVYSWLLMQFSGWEDEKIKKWKNIFKWTIIWFFLLISSSWIIYVVINVIFGLRWS
jgi:hypothetical protein